MTENSDDSACMWDLSVQEYHGGQEWEGLPEGGIDLSVTTNWKGLSEDGMKAAMEAVSGICDPLFTLVH